MKSLLIVVFGLIYAWSFAQNNASSLQEVRVDVVYLASDYLKGRATGTSQEKLAANYLISRFEEIGLTPMGESGTWLQPFKIDYQPDPHSDEGAIHLTGRNVAGYIDNGSATTVIIGAHYDHIGEGAIGSRHTGEPAIHNGADDNASGVAALLYIANYLKHQSEAKQHNYLFLGFSGEELGLYGSKYFATHPTVDLGKVSYMLNLDMVGRLNKEKMLMINGVGTSPVWKPLLEQIEVAGIKITTTESGIGASDHTSFYLKDLPVLHFFTGLHQQYHKPSDDAYLVNFAGILDVSAYVIAVIESLNGQEKIPFTKTKEESNRQMAAFKVTLGVMPDYTFNGEGMRIDKVLADRPAAKADVQDGDVVIQIGDVKVNDIYDYMDGLGLFNIGDETIVIVRRGADELIKKVKFQK